MHTAANIFLLQIQKPLTHNTNTGGGRLPLNNVAELDSREVNTDWPKRYEEMQEQQNFTRLQQISVCSFDTNLERQTALLNPALNKLPVLHCIANFHIHHSTAQLD